MANGPKILLIEDTIELNRMYAEKFEMDGYHIETALDGEEGLRKIVEFKPDLVLLDVMMPKINGLQVLERLKEDEETKHIPVILLSNMDKEHDDIHRGLKLGAVSYIVKADATPGDVVTKVKEVLEAYTKDKYLPNLSPVS